VIATQPLPNNGHCLRSCYLATAVVQMLISRSLPSNGSTCHNIMKWFRNFVYKETVSFLVIYEMICSSILKFAHVCVRIRSPYIHL
jgi:hypothetical protein